MRSINRILTVVAATLALSTSAHAANLFTAMAEAPYDLISNEMMYCTVVNASPLPLKLTIQTIDYNGLVVNSTGPVQLQPDEAKSLPGTGKASYCKFAVVGSPKSVVSQAVYARISDHRYTAAVPAY